MSYMDIIKKLHPFFFFYKKYVVFLQTPKYGVYIYVEVHQLKT
jgi:hypothetical protein